MRSWMRHRSDLVQMTNPHIQHMHQALTQRNVQIHHGINDIPGLTGLAIVDAMGDGRCDPLELAKLRDPRIQASEETMVRSRKGNGRPEHLFTLQQSRQMYQHYQEQMAACDAEIEKLLVRCPGWHCARTTTSPEGGWRGGAGGECTTGPGTCFEWRRIVCITTKARWATICAGGRANWDRREPPRRPPTRSRSSSSVVSHK